MFSARRPEVGQEQPTHITVPAGHGRWRRAQLHAAGIHTTAQYADGQAHLGPLSPDEYRRAWAVLERQERPADRAAWWLPWSTVAWVALVVAGVISGGFALPAIALMLVFAVPVAGAYLVAAWLTARGALRRQQLGTRHPDPSRRRLARLLMPLPWGCLAVIALAAGLAVMAAMAFAMI